MTSRHLTITMSSDWKAALRSAAHASMAGTYQGETLNFESPGQLFAQLTDRRWELIRQTQGKGPLAIRELARRVNRDVKRVHDDVQALCRLGILERTETGGVFCPFASLHIDMVMEAA